MIFAKIKAASEALDGQLSKLGTAGATIVMTVTAVAGAVWVHFLIRTFEGLPVQFIAVINISIEMTLVGAPIIYYARGVIARLRRSQRELNDMSRKLTRAVALAEEGSKAKSAFLANMSHELRTPLNAILGFSEIMKDQHLGPVNNPRYLSYAGDIHMSGRHLLGIINDVLDLAKIESGKMSLDDAEEFALAPALSASFSMLKSLGDKHMVTVDNMLGDADVRVVAVERMIRQVVINLVGNAIKFTPQGGRVHLSSRVNADGGYSVCVHDTGIGMSAEEIANAVTPFGQNRARMAVRHEGTGLGLPLAKAMMELHGGFLEIDSVPDQGTIVTLRFPPERVTQTRRAAA